MDRKLIGQDEHFAKGCTYCHRGDDSKLDKGLAHKGRDKRPSDNLKTCEECHAPIVSTYRKSLHFTTAGQRNRVTERMSPAEGKHFDSQVFEKSCRSCHASCGDCHVKSPEISGISVGFIQGHRFVKKDEGKTCAFCHGGRVYPEYTGEYGGTADVHYQKGMMCMDCHSMEQVGTHWQQSNHKQFACIDCHLPDTHLLAQVAYKTRAGLNDLYHETLRSYPAAIMISAEGKRIARGNCLRCHYSTIENTPMAGQGGDCLKCHRHLVHGRGPGKGGIRVE